MLWVPEDYSRRYGGSSATGLSSILKDQLPGMLRPDSDLDHQYKGEEV